MTDVHTSPGVDAPASRASTEPIVVRVDDTRVRVAYLVNRYPKGSHTFIRREIQALESLGVEVHRFSIRPPDDDLVDPADRDEAKLTHGLLARPARVLGATLAALARSPARWLRALWSAWRLGRRSHRGRLRHLAYFAEACALAATMRRLGVSHVHAHFGTNPAAVALLCHELGGGTFSLTIHGSEEFDMPHAIGLTRKLEASAFAAAISDFGRSQLYRYTALEHWPRMHIVRCGVDAEFAEAEPTPPPEVPRLVFVGRLCEEKGLPLLLQAARQLTDDGVDHELEIVGDGPLRPTVERLVEELDLHSRVTLHGWCPGDEVRRHLLRSRALVLPSFAEGLPVVLMESMALARPVVATQIAGIPELVQSAKTGWLVPPGDVVALARAMRDALTAPIELVALMGITGRELVLERHDARRSAAALHELFRSIRPPARPAEGPTPPAE